MPDPDRTYMDRVSGETDFLRDPLEKVYRLIEILETIVSAPGIQDKVVLKGGTALQFLYLDFKRLSMDIDFNYIGSVEKRGMMEERKDIHKMLSRIFNEFGYILEKNISSHALEQYVLTYENCVGNNDRMKVEVNYLERLPVLPIVQISVKHPFRFPQDILVPTYRYEELAAQKTRALINRATPKDLYDLYLISKTPMDLNLFRKVTIFYLCLDPQDVRKRTIELIKNIDEKDIKRQLAPMLRRREYSVDLESMKDACLALVELILDLSEDELVFLNDFYEKNVFDQKRLFGDAELKTDLTKHPGIEWRFRQRNQH